MEVGWRVWRDGIGVGRGLWDDRERGMEWWDGGREGVGWREGDGGKGWGVEIFVGKGVGGWGFCCIFAALNLKLIYKTVGHVFDIREKTGAFFAVREV